MKKRIGRVFFLGITIFLSGCTSQDVVYEDFEFDALVQDSQRVSGENEPVPSASNSAQKSAVVPSLREEKKLFAPLPSVDSRYRYYRSPLSQEVIGQARVKFVNEKTNLPVVGHALDCNNCIDVYSTGQGSFEESGHYLETNAQGEVIVNLTEKEGSLSYARVEWYQYASIPLQVGEDKVVKIPPHIVGQNQTLGYPKVSYTKNSDNKTRVQVFLKDKNGNPISNYNIDGTGPIFDQKRVSIWGQLKQGNVLMDAPINGVYRLQFLRQTPIIPKSSSDPFGSTPSLNNNQDSVPRLNLDSFYQIGVLSGHTAVVEIREKEGAIPAPKPLQPDHVERGFILVCVLDNQTKKSVFATVGIPQSNIQFTASKKYKDYGCTEVPKSFQEIYIPASGIHNGHTTLSTKNIDAEGVLYVFVNTVKR